MLSFIIVFCLKHGLDQACTCTVLTCYLTWLCLLWNEQFMENLMSQVLDGIDLAVLVVTGTVHGACDESGAGWY